MGFSRFQVLNPKQLDWHNFSPFEPNSINLSAYPYLPQKSVPNYSPSNAEQYAQKAALMLSEHKWEEACRYYRKRLQLLSECHGAHSEATRLAREDLATSLLILGDIDKARALLDIPTMHIEIDGWDAYYTTNHVLEFLFGDKSLAQQGLQEQFNKLNTPIHPTAFTKRYGLTVVANNLGVVLNSLNIKSSITPEDCFDLAQNTAKFLRQKNAFLEVITNNNTPQNYRPGPLLSPG